MNQINNQTVYFDNDCSLEDRTKVHKGKITPKKIAIAYAYLSSKDEPTNLNLAFNISPSEEKSFSTDSNGDIASLVNAYSIKKCSLNEYNISEFQNKSISVYRSKGIVVAVGIDSIKEKN